MTLEEMALAVSEDTPCSPNLATDAVYVYFPLALTYGQAYERLTGARFGYHGSAVTRALNVIDKMS